MVTYRNYNKIYARYFYNNDTSTQFNQPKVYELHLSTVFIIINYIKYLSECKTNIFKLL